MSEPITHKYNIGDTVLVRVPRCACVGGGYDEVRKVIQKVTHIPHNGMTFYHISSERSVPECNIIRKL